jgi:hypothetical protein
MTDPPGCGALKLPRLRSRQAAASLQPGAMRSTMTRTVVATTVLALILVGALAHFHADISEQRAPRVADDSIEAWLRHMTITHATPRPASPLDAPDGL